MGFVIHWHESAMDLHVFPILIPPPSSLSTRSLWVFPEHQAWALVSCIQPGLVIWETAFFKKAKYNAWKEKKKNRNIVFFENKASKPMLKNKKVPFSLARLLFYFRFIVFSHFQGISHYWLLPSILMFLRNIKHPTILPFSYMERALIAAET